MSEFMGNMKLIKLYSWEKHLIEKVRSKFNSFLCFYHNQYVYYVSVMRPVKTEPVFFTHFL